MFQLYRYNIEPVASTDIEAQKRLEELKYLNHPATIPIVMVDNLNSLQLLANELEIPLNQMNRYSSRQHPVKNGGKSKNPEFRISMFLDSLSNESLNPEIVTKAEASKDATHIFNSSKGETAQRKIVAIDCEWKAALYHQNSNTADIIQVRKLKLCLFLHEFFLSDLL